MREKLKKLMIVAHPDDEIIFGGAELSRYENYKVVCVGGDLKYRRDEFFRAMVLIDCPDFEIWGIDLKAVPDNTIKNQITPKETEQAVSKKIKKLIESGNFEKIVTHEENGEYGHNQHKMIHRLVKENLKGKDIEKLHCFCLGEDLLPVREVGKKLEAMQAYESESVLIESIKGMNTKSKVVNWFLKEDIIKYT
jgi:LmbE family N-acetylglucosaminyl deacetylase